jgi:hypothetical protein
MGLILCGLAFAATLLGAFYSRMCGLGVAIGIGYVFGIVRANSPDTYGFFVFDAAMFGLYLSLFAANWPRPRHAADRALLHWFALLIGWVSFMFLLPVQHPLIQLVGLRGNAFLLPCLLIGSRLTDGEARDLALWLACLNLVALGFAVAEFVLGVPAFFPRNPVTEIIYRSQDLAGNTAFRIPACFNNAHSYAGTMVMTLPWLVGRWIQPGCASWRRWLLVAGMAAAVVGVFMAGARVPVVQLTVLLAVITFSGKMSAHLWIGWALMLAGIGYIVSGEERLQRFLSLQKTEEVFERLEYSVNMSFLELVVTYPLGNGLGGGGTSVPYFLRYLVQNPIWIENEFCRILLELGVVGLGMWLGFVCWFLARPAPRQAHPWSLGCRLLWFACLANFLLALLGTGMMTAIPQTALLFLGMGFLVVPRQAMRKRPPPARAADRVDVIAQPGQSQSQQTAIVAS